MNATEMIEALEEAADEAGAIARSYSGRAMYGSHCFAIQGSTKELLETMQRAAIAIGEPLPAPEWDAMGRDYVWYWPNWEVATDA